MAIDCSIWKDYMEGSRSSYLPSKRDVCYGRPILLPCGECNLSTAVAMLGSLVLYSLMEDHELMSDVCHVPLHSGDCQV